MIYDIDRSIALSGEIYFTFMFKNVSFSAKIEILFRVKYH